MALTFMNTNKHLHLQNFIDANFEVIKTPSGFKSIKLYKHQAAIIAAMINLEDNRVLTIRADTYNDITDQPASIETSAMILSGEFGSGKTIELLGFIMERKIPKAFPVHANSIIISPPIKGRNGRNARRGETIFQHEITQKFSGNALLKPNVIVVSSSVLIQWESAIKDYTNLRYFMIDGVHSMRKFQAMINQRKAGKGDPTTKYDIILMKNGKLTGKMDLDNDTEEDRNKDCRPMINVFWKVVEGLIVSRWIIDDYDTSSGPSGSHGGPALFTIYVSATTRQEKYLTSPLVTYKNITELVMNRPTPLAFITSDETLFTNFNVKTTDEFTEESTKITIIQGYQYVYDNPDDNYIRLLGTMGADDANDIMEMLNGDAIGTAAEALGIKTKSVADIFQRMLDKKYEKFMYDQDVIEVLEKVKTLIGDLDEHPEEKRPTFAELDAIRSAITKKQVPNDKLRYYSQDLDRYIDEMLTEFKEAKEIDGMAINRVIDNVKEGMCQVCCLPLESFDAFIVRCCGLIVCDVCGIKGNNVTIRYSRKHKGNALLGSCANCKADVDPRCDLIFLDKSFNVENLLKAKGDETEAICSDYVNVEPELIVDVVPDELDLMIAEIKNPKLKALLAICKGRKPEKIESIVVDVPHLLKGRVDIPPIDGAPRKVLVFANHNETLNNVEEFLVAQGIDFMRLGGTFRDKADTVDKFRTYGTVLLINSQQNCAGINLEFCSDIVFYHKIQDTNVSSQVVGRGQRLGRTCNLRLHYLCYKNEKI